MKFKYSSIQTAYLTDDEFAATNISLNDFEFKTSLDVFKDHFGFRRGEVHTLVGTKGAGKSTWCKTILSELTWNDKRVLLYISEENRDKYVHNLNRTFRINTKTAEDVEKYLNNIAVVSEMDNMMDSPDDFFISIENIISNLEIDIVLFDNFTTSFLSEQYINEQSRILRRFKTLANDFNIPVFLFFHTSKNYDPKRLDGDSIRGSATGINIGSYNYVIYQHKDGNYIRNFIHTEKARYHNKSNKKIYEVVYNYDLGIFTESKQITSKDYRGIVDDKRY